MQNIMLKAPPIFPATLYLDIGAGDLELGKKRVQSLITGEHLDDCPACHGNSKLRARPLSRDEIWTIWLRGKYGG